MKNEMKNAEIQKDNKSNATAEEKMLMTVEKKGLQKGENAAVTNENTIVEEMDKKKKNSVKKANLPKEDVKTENLLKVDEITTVKEYERKKELAIEIKGLDKTMHYHKNQMLVCMAEIGEKLIEAKSLLGHGNFGNWCKEELNYSQRTANNYMRITTEYKTSGLLNSQEIANLPYTKAIALLALEADEREEFLHEHDVNEKTVEELKQDIDQIKKEKEEIQKALAVLEAERENFEAQKNDLNDLVKRQREEAIELTKQIDIAEKQRREAINEADEKARKAAELVSKELSEQLAEKKTELDKAEEEMNSILQKQQEVEVAIKAGAKKEAEEAAQKVWAEKVKELEKKLAEAEKKKKEALEKGNQEAKMKFDNEARKLRDILEKAEARRDEALKKAEEAEKKILDNAMATSLMKIGLLSDNLKHTLRQLEYEWRDLDKENRELAETSKEEINKVIETFMTKSKLKLTVIS